MREYFHAYHSILESIEPLDDAERGRLFTALLSYSATGETPLLTGNERFLFPALRGQIDRDRARYEERCAQNRRNGALGGRPPLPKPYAPQTPPKTKEKEKEKEKEKAISSTEEPVDGTQEARRFFAENFGPVSPYLGSRFAHYRALGIEEPLLVAALEEAARTSASAPWRYAEVILEECLARGLQNPRRLGRPPRRPAPRRPQDLRQLPAGRRCALSGQARRIADPRYLDELPVFRKRPPRGGGRCPRAGAGRGAMREILPCLTAAAQPFRGMAALCRGRIGENRRAGVPESGADGGSAGEEEPAAAAGNGAERTEKISSFGAGERSPMAFGTARSEGRGGGGRSAGKRRGCSERRRSCGGRRGSSGRRLRPCGRLQKRCGAGSFPRRGSGGAEEARRTGPGWA